MEKAKLMTALNGLWDVIQEATDQMENALDEIEQLLEDLEEKEK